MDHEPRKRGAVAPPIQYIVEGGHRLARHHRAVRQQERRVADHRRGAADRASGHAGKRAAHSRHRNAGRADPLGRRLGRMARRATRLPSTPRKFAPPTSIRYLCARIRASILLAGPLLARCGEVALPPPGGDVIGRRRLDTHFLAFEQLGATVTATDRLEFRASQLKGADVFLDEPSVTATENALIAAVAAHGTTYLRNVASEPHVQDLAHFLVALGARIEGIGTNTMIVHGPATLGTASYSIGPDHIEVGSLIGLAAVTRSPLAHRARRRRASALDPDGVRAARHRLRGRGRRSRRAVEPDPEDPGRFRRPCAETRGPAVAGVPGRSDVDRDRDRDPVRRRDPDVREDVRIADVLRRQADLDGRPHRAVRSAPRHRRRSEPAARRAR